MTDHKKPNKFQRAGEVFREKGAGGFFRHLGEFLYYRPSLVLKRDMSERDAARLLITDIVQSGKARSLDELDLAKLKKSELLFILGSGCTVNDLTEEDWLHVAEHDSVGLNFWIVHDFVPTYFFFEAGNEPTGARDEIMKELINRKAELYHNVPFICNHRHWSHLGKSMDDIPIGARANLYLHAPYYFPIESRRLLRRALSNWRPDQLGSLIHHRGSLSAAVTFGALAGYQKIITIGVDLNDPTYFWEAEPERYAALPTPSSEASQEVHATAAQGAGAPKGLLPIDQLLVLLDECTLQPRKIELFVSSGKSRLHPRFPVYQPLK